MDWDLDGKVDIISGCYWTKGTDGGHIQMLKGKGSLDFEKATALLSSAEKPLENVELKADADADGMDENQTKNICTQQHAVDYDGDGDLDLVVGCFASSFFLYENEGSDMENRLVEKPLEMDLKSPDYHAAPHLADFDGDGDLDLLSGGGSGGAYIAINEGTRTEPKYGEFMELLPKPANSREPQRESSLVMGAGTRVWATDYNGDGLMDLLVGDNVSLSQPADGVSEEDFQKKKAEHTKKTNRLMARYQELMKSGRTMGDDVQEEFFKTYDELRKSTEKFEESASTGFVWLLIQKPKAETGKEVTQN